MYDGLTPLFDHVTNADLNQYFKSEKLRHRHRRAGHGRDRPAPRRDHHPRQVRRSARHAHDATTTASGRPAGSRPRTAACCSSRRATTPASRRSTRRARRDRPDRGPAELPAQRADRGVVSKQTQVLQQAGPGGRGGPSRHRHVHLPGINDYFQANSPSHGALDPERHLRPERAQGPVRRPGRRRRGAPLRSSSAASSSGSARAKG